MTLSKSQKWMRGLSERLLSSYRSTGLIEHKVTKGESREYQILHVLRLLPTALQLDHDVVIVDSHDVESPRFDGVLYDRNSWPLLFEDPSTRIAMLESVAVALETKSSLNLNEIEDCFGKGRRLRAMHRCERSGSDGKPAIAVFAYECPNIGLSFLDYCAAFRREPRSTPSIVAILNQGLFALRQGTQGLAIAPQPDHVPVLLQTGEDTLLAFLYYLSWHTSSLSVTDVFKEYSREFFANVDAFSFDIDFLSALDDREFCAKARQYFTGKSGREIEKTYANARQLLLGP